MHLTLIAAVAAPRKWRRRFFSGGRTVELRNSKLIVLGEMVGIVAHEVSTPLSVLLLRLERARQELSKALPDGGETVKAELDKATDVTTRIGGIIRNLRNFSRDQSRDPVQPVPIRVIVEDAVALCGGKLRSSGVEFKFECEGDLSVIARGTEITQVILNLLSNSIYAIRGQEGAWVRVQVRGDQSLVTVKVTDSGPSIPEQVAKNMMRPHFTTKPVGEGTGIGLTISKQIARAHNGDLRFSKGEPHTTFVLTLPAARAA